MERLLIVNADDYGLSKGQNYGIIDVNMVWSPQQPHWSTVRLSTTRLV